MNFMNKEIFKHQVIHAFFKGYHDTNLNFYEIAKFIKLS